MYNPFTQTYLFIVAIAMAISAFLQIALPCALASSPIWECALGWQREIAFWNVAGVLMLVIALVLNNRVVNTVVVVFCVALTAFLGGNHFVGALSESAPSWHLALGFVNLIGVGCGAGLLMTKQLGGDQAPTVVMDDYQPRMPVN